jgi:hypothetical protein
MAILSACLNLIDASGLRAVAALRGRVEILGLPARANPTDVPWFERVALRDELGARVALAVMARSVEHKFECFSLTTSAEPREPNERRYVELGFGEASRTLLVFRAAWVRESSDSLLPVGDGFVEESGALDAVPASARACCRQWAGLRIGMEQGSTLVYTSSFPTMIEVSRDPNEDQSWNCTVLPVAALEEWLSAQLLP